MGELKRKREGEGAVSEADKALKSPRLEGQAATGKSLESLDLLRVQYAAASPSDSSESSPETTSSSDSDGTSGRCEHMCLDSESVDIAVYDIKDSEELPTCLHPRCRITWKGASDSKEGIMKCIECHYIACAVWPMDLDHPQGHAVSHAANDGHYVAQWYHEPNLGYCFVCARAMRLSDNQDHSSYDEVDRKVKDDRGVASKTRDGRGILPSSSDVDWAMVASNSKVDWAMVASNAMDKWGMVAKDDASGYATGDGYVIRGMPNYGNTCYMNASLQCLLALGKLRTMILRPNAWLGDIGLHLRQLFLETSSGNNARYKLDPQMILGSMLSLYPNRFKVGKMEDSHEFLISLCEQFPTIGSSIFSCELIQTISCKSCSHNSVTHQSADGLQLAVPSKNPPARSKPLQVDSTEVQDTVQGRLQTQKNDGPGGIVGVKESTADSHNPEEKEKAQSSDIVHDEAEHMNSLATLEDCLKLFSHDLIECKTCSKIAAGLPETNGTKNVEPVMASTNVNTTVDGDQTGLSDRKSCPSERSSDFSSLSVESPSLQPYRSDSHHQVILSEEITSEEVTSGESCGEKDLASCSTANEKAESHEGVEEAVPSCLTTDEQTDMLSTQDIQDASTQKPGNEKQVMYDHSAQHVAEKQKKQTDSDGGAIQTQLISKLPPVLTIQLKRYVPDKLSGHVSFKEILHIGPFMDPSSEDKDKSSYLLVGVVEHIGLDVNTGHYIAYVRASRKQQGSGPSSWVCASDTIIRRVSLEEVLRSEAYILFYERIDD